MYRVQTNNMDIIDQINKREWSKLTLKVTKISKNSYTYQPIHTRLRKRMGVKVSGANGPNTSVSCLFWTSKYEDQQDTHPYTHVRMKKHLQVYVTLVHTYIHSLCVQVTNKVKAGAIGPNTFVSGLCWISKI